MAAPLGIRPPLNRHEQMERPASRAPALHPQVPRPSQGPVIGNHPVGLAHHQVQVGGQVPHKVVHLPAPTPTPVRALPVVTNPPVPVVGRPLPGAVFVEPTAPIFVPSGPVAVHVPRPQAQVVIANPQPRRHITVMPLSWTPVAAIALAILGIGAVASALVAAEVALVIFPVALLFAVGIIAAKALSK